MHLSMLNFKNLAIIGYILFDWAIAPASALIVTFIFPTFFVSSIADIGACNSISLDATSAEHCGSMLWGYTATLSAICIAFLSPIFGKAADKFNNCKTWIALASIFTALACSMLWFTKPGAPWIWISLLCVGIITVMVDIAYIFYNALLTSIVDNTNVGKLSSVSWAAGYFGSIITLVVILVFLVLPDTPWFISKQDYANIRIIGPLTGLWLIIFSAPFFLFTPDRKKTLAPKQKATMIKTIKRALSIPGLFQYMIARMLISDALVTAFTFGGILASTYHGFSNQEVLMLGIAFNLSAGLGGVLLSNLPYKFNEYDLITYYTFALLVTGVYITLAPNATHFWIAGIGLSFFIGPVQASTRSVFAKLCPKEHAAELFGLYMFSGKATAFLGPAMYTALIYMTGSQKLGMCSIIVILAAAWYLLVTNTQIAEQLKTESDAHADSFDLEPSPAVN